MSDTIQTHWQYRTLMLASIKDSDHFTRSCIVYPRMQIKSFFAVAGNKATLTYCYMPDHIKAKHHKVNAESSRLNSESAQYNKKWFNTIEHDYQYKGLMYVSIAESKCFNDERIGSSMRIIMLGCNSEDNKDTEYIYIPAANKSELIYHTPPKRGVIGKALDLLFNIFNKAK